MILILVTCWKSLEVFTFIIIFSRSEMRLIMLRFVGFFVDAILFTFRWISLLTANYHQIKYNIFFISPTNAHNMPHLYVSIGPKVLSIFLLLMLLLTSQYFFIPFEFIMTSIAVHYTFYSSLMWLCLCLCLRVRVNFSKWKENLLLSRMLVGATHLVLVPLFSWK